MSVSKVLIALSWRFCFAQNWTARTGVSINNAKKRRKVNMDFNDFKAELAKGIQSELDDRGMKADVEFHHVDKMNQS